MNTRIISNITDPQYIHIHTASTMYTSHKASPCTAYSQLLGISIMVCFITWLEVIALISASSVTILATYGTEVHLLSHWVQSGSKQHTTLEND